MTDSNNTNIEINFVNDSIEDEGEALAVEWKKISKADKRRFNKHTKADGFDSRLGRVMVTLQAEAEAEGRNRIDSKRLKEVGIAGIAKQRRAEAKWFVENEEAARDHMKASKKGFTNLGALQRSMKQAEQKALKEAAEGETEVEASEAETVEAEVTTVTAQELALDVLVQAETNGITIEDFLVALKEQLDLLDSDTEITVAA